ncbi:MAG: hypothetical protein H6816_16000 [Phycisphaerales bacterium]|nr:hypothetical protein [Phycisphaerales bacterium]
MTPALSVNGDNIYLYATTITDPSNDWCREGQATGEPNGNDCNAGEWCVTTDYAGNESGNGWLTVTNFQNLSIPAGQGICEVRFNALVRVNMGATGKCEARVTLPGFGSKIFLSPTIANDDNCAYAFSAPQNSIVPADFGASGPWTAALVNSLTVEVRRANVNPSSAWFRCKAVRIFVQTGVDSDADGWADCIDQCPNDPNKVSPGNCGCGNPEPGTPCNDGNPCTVNDVIQPDCGCAGTPMNCDDGNPCTIDTCVNGVCVHTPMNCDDGNPCTIDTCVNGVCVHTPMNCDDGNPCTIDTCVNGVCVHTPVDCSDGDPCTIDVCVNGVCTHTPMNCDDGDPCTIDTCENGICMHTPIDCDDGDPGTVDTCVNGVCVHTPKPCDDGDPCTADSFDPASGACVHVPLTADSDGDGTPDCADICPGGDDSIDCDGDGTPDFCQFHAILPSIAQSPFGAGMPLAANFAGVPQVSSPVSVQVAVAGDLDGSTEFVTVLLSGTVVGTLFGLDGANCPAIPQVATVTIAPTVFNQAVAAGGGTVQLMVQASGAVSATECDQSSAQVTLVVPLSFTDCNGNGIFDACEIADGTATDCNGNGILDSCEPGLPDCNGNGTPDLCDIQSGRSADKNGDGVPDECNYACGDF